MESAEAHKEDEEKGQKKSTEVETKAPITSSADENTFTEVGGNENKNKPVTQLADDEDGLESPEIVQDGLEPQTEMQNKKGTEVPSDKEKEITDVCLNAAHGKRDEPKHTVGKDVGQKQTEHGKDGTAQQLISASEMSVVENTQVIKLEATRVEEKVLPQEQLKYEGNAKSALVSGEEEKKTEMKQLQGSTKEAGDIQMYATQDLEKVHKIPEKAELSSKNEMVIPEIVKYSAHRIPQIQAVDLRQDQATTGDTTENKGVLFRPEQTLKPKQTESDPKKNHLRTSSRAVAKRRASETPTFKYTQLAQASGKGRNIRGLSQLSLGKTVSTSTGIKSSRSAEELQRSEAVPQAAARESTPETRRCSVNINTPLKIMASPRRKSETPARSVSGGKTVTMEAKITSYDKQHIYSLTEDCASNGTQSRIGKNNKKPLEDVTAQCSTKEENKITGQDEIKIPQIAGTESAKKLVEEEIYSDIKEIKTQQNMKMATADMAPANKTFTSKMGETETISEHGKFPEDQQVEEARKYEKNSPEKLSAKQIVQDKTKKENEDSFVQKQIEEMSTQPNTTSLQDASQYRVSSKDNNTKLSTESGSTETHQLLEESNTKDQLVTKSGKSEDTAISCKLPTKPLTEEKQSHGMQNGKYKSENIPVSTKLGETQKHIHVKDNNIPNAPIRIEKADESITTKTGVQAKGAKQQTPSSKLTRQQASRSLLQFNKDTKTGESVQGSANESENRKRSPPKSLYPPFVAHDIPTHDTNETSDPKIRNKLVDVHGHTNDFNGKHESKEYIHKRDQPKQKDTDAIINTTKSLSADDSRHSAQIHTTSKKVGGEVWTRDVKEKSVLRTHEELDQFISNQIQAELISNWVMNGEGSTPGSPHDLSPPRKTRHVQLVEPKVVHEQLQRGRPAIGSAGTKVVAAVHAGGHTRLAPIKDEEESKDCVLSPHARVHFDEEVGRGCGGIKSSSCKLYFGVKNYLNQFYDPDAADHTQQQGFYSIDDDEFEQLVETDKEERRRRCCRGFWFRAGVWAGVNLVLVGLIAILVGYLTPPREAVVGYQDNLEILDRWAIAFNHRLELCRLAGLAVLCCGVIVLAATCVLSGLARRCCSRRSWASASGGGGPPTSGLIPATEHLKSVQPLSWHEEHRLATQLP